jgi:hypothetical protein
MKAAEEVIGAPVTKKSKRGGKQLGASLTLGGGSGRGGGGGGGGGLVATTALESSFGAAASQEWNFSNKNKRTSASTGTLPSAPLTVGGGSGRGGGDGGGGGLVAPNPAWGWVGQPGLGPGWGLDLGWGWVTSGSVTLLHINPKRIKNDQQARKAPPREVHRAIWGKGPSMAKIFAASRRKYQALGGLTDRTATVIPSGLMIYKKSPLFGSPCLLKPGTVFFFLVSNRKN